MQRRRESITELENRASAALDTRSTREILRLINREDHKVAAAVRKALPQIERAVNLAVKALAEGGRLVYLGAGTSGRLGVLDAAECIPTFGTDQVLGVMAGAPEAMFRPVERKEDNPQAAARDLRRIRLNSRDALVGISASGRTPYTLGGMRYARRVGAKTIAVTSSPRAPIRRLADVSIVPAVGPEVLAGSTRMKAGTAAKLVLNMVSTTSMIRLGRVLAHWMVNLQLNSRKLWRRAEGILMKAASVSRPAAARALERSGRNPPAALLMLWKDISKEEALRRLRHAPDMAGLLRAAWSEHHTAAGRA